MKKISTDKKANIVLIMCDQMRGDCMGTAGHPDVKTPYLDSLAAEGVYFPNSYSACPSCIPARAALFTGLSQAHHGRVGYQDGIDWNYPNMLPKLLSENGYHTECVGKLHVHPPLRRCGFDSLTLHDGYIGYYRNPDKPYRQHQLAHDSYLHRLRSEHPDADVNDTGLECNSWIARPWLYDEMSHPTNWAVTQSIDFLQKRDPDKPFFLMTSFVRPHPPLDAPAPYFDMYNAMELRAPAEGDWADKERSDREGVLYDSPFGCADPELRRQAMVGYYACITHMDHQIGRLLQALYREGILEDTIIIFTSDHGELLFDHHLFRKVQPYDGSVRVPLLMRVGKNVEGCYPARGSVPDTLTELRDIMPTILDMAGIKDIPPMDGKNLMPSDNCNVMPDVRTYLHGEHSFGELSNHYIVTKTDKYIWFSGSDTEQYFKFDSDPREETNLIDSVGCRERIELLRGLLISELKDRPEGYSDGQSLIPGKTPLNSLPILNTKEN